MPRPDTSNPSTDIFSIRLRSTGHHSERQGKPLGPEAASFIHARVTSSFVRFFLMRGIITYLCLLRTYPCLKIMPHAHVIGSIAAASTNRRHPAGCFPINHDRDKTYSVLRPFFDNRTTYVVERPRLPFKPSSATDAGRCSMLSQKWPCSSTLDAENKNHGTHRRSCSCQIAPSGFCEPLDARTLPGLP
jgi:hypothetical protein